MLAEQGPDRLTNGRARAGFMVGHRDIAQAWQDLVERVCRP
jgi:hypothetical protein